jgi:hypothetical protein
MPLVGCSDPEGDGGSGGAGGTAGAGGEFAVTRIVVAAEDTDPAIDDPIGGNHAIYVPSTAMRPELFVVLVGTGFRPGTGEGPTAWVKLMAQHMKVIIPQYVNDTSIGGTCRTDSDPDCAEKLRLERIYGTDTSPLDDVSPTNGIVHRVVKLLEWLDAEQPGVGWSDYLEAGQPRWDRMTLSGFSQGAGMAALIARDHEVGRVLMFAGSGDFRAPRTEPPESADWITDPKVTPIDRHFGFRHVDDAPGTKRNWEDMRLPGPPVIVDDAAPPYSGSHFLETNVDVPPDDVHGSVIVDLFEPDGTPTFKETWLYMCCDLP